MTAIVLGASAGVEFALQTPIGRRLQAKIPRGATTWVPEHYYAETTAVLRQEDINKRLDSARIEIALDRLLSAPARRVSVRPLVIEAWRLRYNLTIADALYVVVARHLDAELVTTDLRLANAPSPPISTITP